MRYAHIENNIVANVSVWEFEPEPFDDYGRLLVASEEANIGWSYDGVTFFAPAFEPDINDVPGNLHEKTQP